VLIDGCRPSLLHARYKPLGRLFLRAAAFFLRHRLFLRGRCRRRVGRRRGGRVRYRGSASSRWQASPVRTDGVVLRRAEISLHVVLRLRKRNVVDELLGLEAGLAAFQRTMRWVPRCRSPARNARAVLATRSAKYAFPSSRFGSAVVSMRSEKPGRCSALRTAAVAARLIRPYAFAAT